MKTTFFQKNLPYFLIFLPIIFYWIVFNKYALNLPHWDDYAVRTTVEKINTTPFFSEKLNLIFAQHNEHKIFLTRFMSLIIFQIKGHLDFKWLMILAGLSLIGILFVFFKIFKKYNLSVWAFVPLPYILLTISLYENTFWGMASLQNFGVIFFAFLTFYLLSQYSNNIKDKYLIWAILSASVGVYTSSNGVLIPIIGLLILAFQQKKQPLILWSILSALLLLSYFGNYQKPTDISVSTSSIPIENYLKGLFLTLGAGVEAYQNTINREDLSMAIGLFLCLFSILFSYQTIFKKYNIEKRNVDVFLLACLTFIGITCAGITFSRLGYGIGTLLSSKYKIYSILTFMIFYVVAVKSMAVNRQPNFIKLSIISAFIFNLYCFFFDYDNIRYQHQERLTDDWNSKKTAYEISKKTTDNQILNSIFNIKESEKNIHIELKFQESLGFSNPENGYFILLESDQNSYIFPTKLYWQSKKNFISREFIFNQPIKIVGLQANISKLGIKTDRYYVKIMKIEDTNRTTFKTSQILDIKEVKFDNSKQNW